MKTVWMLLVASLAALLLGGLLWLGSRPGGDGPDDLAKPPATAATQPALRLGIVPERDVFQQRQRYQHVADYLAARLDRPVELATVNTYEAVLRDFEEGQIDGAFLGSLVTVLAMDRLGARVLVKPDIGGGVTSYHGVLFAREDSPITSLDQLPGKRIAMVRATTAGDLFPAWLFATGGLLDAAEPPRRTWVGTHDEVFEMVSAGKADAGAIKNLRLNAMLREHPDAKVRILSEGRPVPNNALVVRKDLPAELARTLSELLLAMHENEPGRAALREIGVERFVPCDRREYAAIYDMVEQLGGRWDKTGIGGPAPLRPAE